MKRICKIILGSLGLYAAKAIACTHLMVAAQDGSLVIGRTMEFAPALNSSFVSSPVESAFNTKDADGNATMSWTAKYGSVYLNGFGLDIVVDGINTEGLSFSYLYLPGETTYMEKPLLKENAIPYLNFGNWILSNFKNISELKSALHNVSVYDFPVTVGDDKNITFPLHAIIVDKTGQSIVVEFIDGKMKVHDTVDGILTNSPTYDWHATNLRNYVSLSPYAPGAIKDGKVSYASTGQGAGMVGLPGDYSPPSRFIKTAMLSLYALPAQDAKSARNLAEHILNNVDIPAGTIRDSDEDAVTFDSVDKTQWTVFKDLKHHKIYFKTYDNQRLMSVSLDKINLIKDAAKVTLSVDQDEDIKDCSALLK